MKIIVKNNDAIKAYKVLMKKINKDSKNNNFLREVIAKNSFITNTKRRQEKLRNAKYRENKKNQKNQEIFDKEEQWTVIQAKKRAKEFKKQSSK